MHRWGTISTLPPPPRIYKPAGQLAGEGVGPGGRGPNCLGLAQNKPHDAVMVAWVPFHSAWHYAICGAPKILLFADFAEFRRLVGPFSDSGEGEGGGGCSVRVQYLIRPVK